MLKSKSKSKKKITRPMLKACRSKITRQRQRKDTKKLNMTSRKEI
jgi:hypothetical protein